MQKATSLQQSELRNPSLRLSGASPRRPSHSRPLLKGRTFSTITVFIKREDKNQTGSHKDRGIWPLIDFYRKKGIKHFVISSSGNAAVSAAYYCKKYGLRLDVFVGKKIPKSKWQKVSKCEGEQVEIHKTQFPRRDAFRFAKETGAQLISTSTDDHCLDGYAKIVKELPKSLDSIFVPASSGALAVGMYQGYKSKVKSQKSKVNEKAPSSKLQAPRFFVCQTSRVHPLVDDGRDTRSRDTRTPSRVSTAKDSMADAISDVIGERKMQVHNIIQKTNGAGVVVEDRFIKQAMKILKKELKIARPSPNGSLAFAGLLKTMEQDEDLIGKRVACLYTGM